MLFGTCTWIYFRLHLNHCERVLHLVLRSRFVSMCLPSFVRNCQRHGKLIWLKHTHTHTRIFIYIGTSLITHKMNIYPRLAWLKCCPHINPSPKTSFISLIAFKQIKWIFFEYLFLVLVYVECCKFYWSLWPTIDTLPYNITSEIKLMRKLTQDIWNLMVFICMA